jgi:hypothetical protein
MENENNKGGKYTGYFSKRLKAGKRRTYFFDVRSTKNGDYFLTITESKKKFDDSFESHKIFLYKEDFKKFMETLTETMDYVKKELMPDYDYDSRPASRSNGQNHTQATETNEDGKEEEVNPVSTSSVTDEEHTTNTPPQIGDDEEIEWN